MASNPVLMDPLFLIDTFPRVTIVVARTTAPDKPLESTEHRPLKRIYIYIYHIRYVLHRIPNSRLLQFVFRKAVKEFPRDAIFRIGSKDAVVTTIRNCVSRNSRYPATIRLAIGHNFTRC